MDKKKGTKKEEKISANHTYIGLKHREENYKNHIYPKFCTKKRTQLTGTTNPKIKEKMDLCRKEIKGNFQ